MLIVIGWLVLFVIACVAWRYTYQVAMLELVFTGKLDVVPFVLLAISVFFTWLCYYTWPFDLTLRVVQ